MFKILHSFFILFLLSVFAIAGTEKTLQSILDESFEGSFPPSGWTKFSDFSWETWKQSTDKSHSGTHSAMGETSYVYDKDIWLVTPALDLSTATRATLYFYEDQVGWENSGGTNSVEVSTTSNNTASAFTPILTMTPSDHTIEGFDGSAVEVDLSAYAGQSTVYIAFHYHNPSSPNYQWFIDDVKVVVPSDHDVAALSLDMDSHYAPNTTVTPKATVKNEGKNTESFDVEFGYYDWYGEESPISTTTVSNLAPGDHLQVSFPQYTFGKVGYKFYVRTKLSGDMDASNDVATRFIDSYPNQKDVVLAEEFTDTECTYCPGAANALDSLYENYGDNLAIVAYHGGFSGNDPFDNSYATDRRSYYGINAYPTCIFGGDRWSVGGASAGSDFSGVYNNYEQRYLAERQEYTPLTMNIIWTENGSNSINATATVTYQAEITLKNLYIRWALTEMHIAYNWETSMDSLQFVERLMIPDANGTVLWSSDEPAAIGTEVNNSISFDIPDSVVKENCQLIAFVQNEDNKEVLVAARVNLGDKPNAVSQSTQSLPQTFALFQNYPNPFNPSTTIRYAVPKAGQIELSLYDISGRKIATLVHGFRGPGIYQYRLNGTDLASGIYFYTLSAGSVKITKKMILLR